MSLCLYVLFTLHSDLVGYNMLGAAAPDFQICSGPRVPNFPSATWLPRETCPKAGGIQDGPRCQDAKMAPRRAPQGPRGLQDNPKAPHDAQDPKMTPKRPKWSQRNPKNAPNESQGRRPKAQGQHIPESFAFLCAFSAFFSCSRSPPRQPASRPKKPPSPKEGLRRPPGRAGGLLSRVPQRLARAVHQSHQGEPWERGDSRS